MAQSFGPTSQDEDFFGAVRVIDHTTGDGFASLTDYGLTLYLADEDGYTRVTLTLAEGDLSSTAAEGDLSISTDGWVRFRIDKDQMAGMCPGQGGVKVVASNDLGTVDLFSYPVMVTEGLAS